MAAFIFSSSSTEVVFCFPEAKDLRFTGLSAEENMQFLTLIKEKYHECNPENTLKIFQVQKPSLKEFAPEDDRKYNFENFPEENFRRRDLELSGSLVEETEMDGDDETDDMFRHTNGNLDKLENRFTPLMSRTISV